MRGAYSRVHGECLRAQNAPDIIEDDGDFVDPPLFDQSVDQSVDEFCPPRKRRKKLDKRHRLQLKSRQAIVKNTRRYECVWKEDVPSGLHCGPRMHCGVCLA